MPTTTKIAVLALLLAGCEASMICDRHCKAEGWESGYSNSGEDQCICRSTEYLYRIMKGTPEHVCRPQPSPPEETP